MRKLMLGTAMVLPLMMAPAFAQTTAPAPAATPAETTTGTPAVDTAPAADAAAAAEDAAQAAEDARLTAAASDKVEQQQAANELRIDWITGTTVRSMDGNDIGNINDVIINGDDGTVKAAIIGVGGFLGIGEKQIAVAWDQLTINYDAQEITSDLTRDEANAAPEYVFRDRESAPAEATSTMEGTTQTETMGGATAPATTGTTTPVEPMGTTAPATGTTTPPAN